MRPACTALAGSGVVPTLLCFGLLGLARWCDAAETTALEEQIRRLEARLRRVEHENEVLRARLPAGDNHAPAPPFGFHRNGVTAPTKRGTF